MSSRIPSPPYPSIDLGEAINRTLLFENSSKGRPLDVELAVHAIGFGSKNGSSISYLNALRQYGLLDYKDGKYKSTQLAARITSPVSDEDERLALSEAINCPDVFRLLKGRLDLNTMSDGDAYSILASEGYSSYAAGKIVRSLRNSYKSYAPYDDKGDAGGNDEKANPNPKLEKGPLDSNAHAFTVVKKALNIFEYRTEDGSQISLSVIGVVDTPMIINTIAAWIEMKKKEMR